MCITRLVESSLMITEEHYAFLCFILIAGMVCQPLLALILLTCLCSIPRALGEDQVEDDNGSYRTNKELSQNEEREMLERL